jgi:uncharacterized phage-like protein YoqJ
MYVTLCGHAYVSQPDTVKQWLRNVVACLISEGAEIFYLGGYGEFDRIAASVLREEKKRHANLQMALVLPYIDANINVSNYDYTVYPPLESVPPRFAILKRNQWMVEVSDVVVAYVTHDWGGAAKTLQYARNKRKHIIQFF